MGHEMFIPESQKFKEGQTETRNRSSYLSASRTAIDNDNKKDMNEKEEVHATETVTSFLKPSDLDAMTTDTDNDDSMEMSQNQKPQKIVEVKEIRKVKQGIKEKKETVE